MEQKSKFVSNREYMANGLSADLEDFVKGSRIKSGYCNLDFLWQQCFGPVMVLPQYSAAVSKSIHLSEYMFMYY